MTAEHGRLEVLTQGRERATTSSRPGGARRSPGPVVQVVVLALLAGAAYAAYQLTGPRLPRLTVAATPRSAGTPAVVAWQPGIDERPTGGVFLTMGAVIGIDGDSSGTVDVLGISGPGVVREASRSLRLTAGGPGTTGVLAADIDCTHLRLPLVRDTYGLRVRVVDGSRIVAGVVPAGSLGLRWAASVASACGSWLARHDLTVTHVSASIDPLQASVDLGLTVQNAGHSTAYVLATTVGPALAVSTQPDGATVVSPFTEGRVLLHVDIRQCDAIPPLPPSASGGVYGTTGDALGLLALVGSRPRVNPDDPLTDGLGPTGVVFGRGEAAAVAEALRSACGGLGPYVTDLVPGGVAFDPKTRVLDLTIRVRGNASLVSDLTLVSDVAPPGDASVYRPLWITSATLRPDRSGSVSATLRYLAPPTGSPCPSFGAWIPAFTVVAHVPVPDGVKTLRYSQLITPLQWPKAMHALCRAAA